MRHPTDAALERLRIATIVNSFSTALALARASDLIATLLERHTRDLRLGMHTFGPREGHEVRWKLTPGRVEPGPRTSCRA